ncbi:MAG: FAD-dependent oxidoreductase [Dehalococcoidales bacterium]|nr:FAD-dependent oxidoreductase [Dehalococcoidales bacterium]
MKTVIDRQEVPVFAEADVVVVGGGPAGIGAALAAARNGAKTILVEKFGSLGGMQTQCYNVSFSFVDPEIQGGIFWDIINGLRKGKAVYKDASPEEARQMQGWGDIVFDTEYYKFMLDNMMAEAGVKLLYHAFGVGAIREGNILKGIFIESIEGKRALLGKVIIDTTGNADIAWKSGASVIASEFPYGPKKGRHLGMGTAFILNNVDIARYVQFKKDNLEVWASASRPGTKFFAQAIAEGKVTGIRDSLLLNDFFHDGRRIWVLGTHYPLPLGHHGWRLEDLTAGEVHLRNASWSILNLLKNNIPGFENAYIEKTPNAPLLRDTHRVLGEYTLTEDDILAGKAFDDSIAISNMFSDIVGPDYEFSRRFPLPFDIPYRCLISKDTDNLLAAGSTISCDLITFAATRYCAPSICTGQAAGTAAALAVKSKTTPNKLNVKALQDVLRKQGARITNKEIPKPILNEYHETIERLKERAKAQK